MNFIVLSYFLTLSYVLKIGPNRSIQPIQSKIKSQFCLVKTGQKPEKSDKNQKNQTKTTSQVKVTKPRICPPSPPSTFSLKLSNSKRKIDEPEPLTRTNKKQYIKVLFLKRGKCRQACIIKFSTKPLFFFFPVFAALV